MQSYILTYAGLERENLGQLQILRIGDVSFCVRDTPPRG